MFECYISSLSMKIRIEEIITKDMFDGVNILYFNLKILATNCLIDQSILELESLNDTLGIGDINIENNCFDCNIRFT
jgi:hypothetical protein